MSDWQPIETAPKDTTDVLLYIPWIDYPVPAYWSERFKKWQILGDHIEVCGDAYVGPSFINTDPTHWMPLPEPPKK